MKKHRKKNAASFQLQFCYSGDELLNYRSGKIDSEMRSRIFHHLNIEKCQRCRDIYLTFENPQKDETPIRHNKRIIDKLQKEMGKYRACPVPLRLEKFQIWTTSPEPKNRQGDVEITVPMAVPVVIIAPGTGEKKPDNIIRVFPVSNDIEFYLEGDSLMINEDSPLRYPFLVEIFNERSMLSVNLEEYRGSLTKVQSRKIQGLRDRHLKRVKIKPDKQYLEWKQKEMDLTEYLTLPVNEKSGEDSAENRWAFARSEHSVLTDVDIILVPYRKAADTSGIELSEIKPCILIDKDNFSLSVVQKGDQVLLRFLSDSLTPEQIFIDDKKVEMNKKADGFFEVPAGYSVNIPESMEITAVVEKNRFGFKLMFRRPYES